MHVYFLRNKKYGKIKNEKGKFTKKSVLVLLSTYLITLFVITLVAGEVLNQNYKVINTALNLTGTRTEVVEDEIINYKSKSLPVNSTDKILTIIEPKIARIATRQKLLNTLLEMVPSFIYSTKRMPMAIIQIMLKT